MLDECQKKWITFFAEMIDYDTKKSLALVAFGKTNLKAFMGEIKVVKNYKNSEGIRDKYLAAG